jgi:hypothetical protein
MLTGQWPPFHAMSRMNPAEGFGCGERSPWRVRFSCRWRSWRMEPGCTPAGFRWAVAGVVAAPPPDTKRRCHRTRNCSSSATLAMRKAADDYPVIANGIRSGSPPEPWVATPRTERAAAFRFAMSASATIVRRTTGCSNSMRPSGAGASDITTTVCSVWRNALPNPTWQSGNGRERLPDRELKLCRFRRPIPFHDQPYKPRISKP